MIAILNWKFGDRFKALYDHVTSDVCFPVKWTHDRPPECEDADACVLFEYLDDGTPSLATIFINRALPPHSAELRAAHELGHLWCVSRGLPRIRGTARYERAAPKLSNALDHFIVYRSLQDRGYDLEADRRRLLGDNLSDIRQSQTPWPQEGTTDFVNQLLHCFDILSTLSSAQQQTLLQAIRSKSLELYMRLSHLLVLAAQGDLQDPKSYRSIAFALIGDMGLTGHLFVKS